MRHTYWILPFVLVALALLVKTPNPTPQLPRPPGVQPVDDTLDPKENPQGRRHWEWQRLHDPATGRIPPDIHRKEVEFAARLPRRQPGVAIGGLNSGVDKFAGWSYRGPWNIGGRTRALAVDVADPSFQTLLAGGVSGGMWRSTDDGASCACFLRDIRMPGNIPPVGMEPMPEVGQLVRECTYTDSKPRGVVEQRKMTLVK